MPGEGNSVLKLPSPGLFASLTNHPLPQGERVKANGSQRHCAEVCKMRQIAAFSVVVVLAIGCGGGKKKDVGGSITGTIKYNGKPVNGGALMVYAKAGNKSTPFAISQEGEYHISDLPEGEYKLVIQPNVPPPSPPPAKGVDASKAAKAPKVEMPKSSQPPTIKIPDKYKKAETTDLKATVTKERQTIDLVLKD
jgi:hypothetical protein